MAFIGIVTGLDGLGKTPLVNLLKKVGEEEEGFLVEVRKVVPDPKKASHEEIVAQAIEEVNSWRDPDVINDWSRIILYDRFPLPDEWVYRPLWEHSPTVWDETFNYKRLERLMLELGVKFVYVEAQVTVEDAGEPYILPPVESYLEVAKNKRDRFVATGDRKVVSHLIRSYNHFTTHSNLPYARVLASGNWFTREQAREILKWLVI